MERPINRLLSMQRRMQEEVINDGNGSNSSDSSLSSQSENSSDRTVLTSVGSSYPFSALVQYQTPQPDQTTPTMNQTTPPMNQSHPASPAPTGPLHKIPAGRQVQRPIKAVVD